MTSVLTFELIILWKFEPSKVAVHLPDIEAILNLNPKLYESKSVPTQVGKKAKAHWKRNITKSQGCDQSSGCGTGEDLNLNKYYTFEVLSKIIMLLFL